MSPSFAEWESAARRLRPRVTVVLGSGLGAVSDRATDVVSVPFAEVPGWPSATVKGHAGSILAGRLAGVPVVIFQGRFHFYEGHPPEALELPVRLARDLGADTLVVTNAAGGIRDDLVPGSLMPICGHTYWRTGETIRGGPSSESYSAELVELLVEIGGEFDLSAPGVYAYVTGPSYETAAEIRAMRAAGMDAVGMSTAWEVDAAEALGMRRAAVSCVTNRGTGLSDGPHDHAEVVRAAARAAERMAGLIEKLVTRLP